MTLDPVLASAVARIARVPQLLVACDYDGTLAPIVEDPATAAPLPEAVDAVRALADLPRTTAAIVSGRARHDLAALSRLPSEVHLVGSHGSEFDTGFVQRLPAELVDLRGRLEKAVEDIVGGTPGVRLEPKPASVAVHTRTATRPDADAIVRAILEGPASWSGVHVTRGKEVVELLVLETHKGTAIDALREQLGASAVLFVGDDITDENAFAHLREPDVGIKIGPGPTRAGYRVDDPEAAAMVLTLLLETRRAWLPNS